MAIVGDGGFAMLMAEMTTAVQHNLPVEVIVLKNNSLAEVKFEQIELGNPSFGCDLSPIDFVAFARACGAELAETRTGRGYCRPCREAKRSRPIARLNERAGVAGAAIATPGSLRR